ncbi:Uncharacterised protein [BD1-7 clade bacterium]|uniref:HNH nuclease domain-containing protein n=1 Tax=BD1-7 clade bacterium TaxID=2029982 RepID=A0A5S9QIA8_9GAMM|nr:Uncharacterised protein [BD1-7 clade bacterium]
MPRIGNDEISLAYQAAKSVYDGCTEKNRAIASLIENVGMNHASATFYLNAFQKMMEGKQYEKTINGLAANYYLENIRRDYGNEKYQSALSSLYKHICYYEYKSGSNCKTLREVHKKHFIILMQDIDYESFSRNLECSVKTSLEESKNDRINRISKAKDSPKPSEYRVEVTVYDRNPDVIAEVLARANGICEKCNKGAPFTRKSDGSPYLEVHHLIHLANGGDDTVENAVAVCPNCHREYHYG